MESDPYKSFRISLRANLCEILQFPFRRMTDDGALKILQPRAFLAGVDSFSPHDLDRTFCRPPRCWSRYRDSAEFGRSRFPRDDSVRTIAGAKKRSDRPAALRVLMLRVESSSQIFLSQPIHPNQAILYILKNRGI